ncbi:hypothetical protein [uncultured Alistipes sp.]|uniref:hypothetical protein n=1 Tax=uncultured Alistipes sp. TaxID=538949 RepID=UPI00260D2F4F|nr:hypothetical protein [uncultured Alistipes sp.]
MKKLFLIVACATMVMGLNAQTLTLPNGKSVPIRLTSEIQSNLLAKLLQKSGIRKNEVIELIYRGFI